MAHRLPPIWKALLVSGWLAAGAGGWAQSAPQADGNERPVFVELEARQQRRDGPLYIADGDVEVRYLDRRLRADHVEYNTEMQTVVAEGGVTFDYGPQHLEARRAEYDIRTGRGRFEGVRGEIRIQHAPNPSLLVTPNPLSFEADLVERLDEETYRIHGARLTVCDLESPAWTFGASRATLHVNRTVALLNANFRLFHIPLVYLPYATAPAGRDLRQTGLLVPDVGTSSRKGFMLGEGFYWAPAEWVDATVGAQWFSRRGWSQTGQFRARPAESIRLSASYFGVVDRGLVGDDGVRVPQGGHTVGVAFEGNLADGWRVVADVTQLSSLRFRLAFASTFGEAVSSETWRNGFVTRNFGGFSLNFAARDYKNFLTAEPETAVVIRRAPEVRFSSVEQAPWRTWPVYFGVEAQAAGVHRDDPLLSTAAMVQRSEVAPRVTVPLRWGPWIGVTATGAFRATGYGARQSGGSVAPEAVWRTTGEATVDLRLPAFERTWQRAAARWKHTVEPAVSYRYVTGVNEFGRFLRFDETDILTDTNEVQYSLTQRLFRRANSGSAEEVVSWRVAQKYYFDPTFGGALVPGRRNVFESFVGLTPFAFADGQRRFSPVVSSVKVTPGGRYDAQVRVDYDTVRGRLATIETLAKVRPYGELEVTLVHYALNTSPVLQPRSNQVRALVGYGSLNRRGWNGAAGLSYDVRNGMLQDQVAQVSYNGSCCGFAFEYRRLALGPLRTENQFRVALIIANIGTFGNLRGRERIF